MAQVDTKSFLRENIRTEKLVSKGKKSHLCKRTQKRMLQAEARTSARALRGLSSEHGVSTRTLWGAVEAV